MGPGAPKNSTSSVFKTDSNLVVLKTFLANVFSNLGKSIKMAEKTPLQDIFTHLRQFYNFRKSALSLSKI